ncbi:MAG: HAMP domain-containing histidine kinase [Acidobacteria bacterium]|nr:HAMP domain-containing histidine kinase [Acidobacteriota bacterium]
MDRLRQRAWLWWLFMGLLVVLCSVLAVLQYRWTGEISVAEHERLKDALQTSLFRMAREFNQQISTAAVALLPAQDEVEQAGLEAAITARYRQWTAVGEHPRIFRRIAIALPHPNEAELKLLDLDSAQWSSQPWPTEWQHARSRAGGRPWPPAEPPASGLIEIPRFRPGEPGPSRFGPTDWLLVELNTDYVRSEVLPILVKNHLGAKNDYLVEVISNGPRHEMIYQSTSVESGQLIAGKADGQVGLFQVNAGEILMRNAGFRDPGGPPAGFGPGPPPGGPGPGGPLGPGRGRWQLSVRHRAGSLEAIVDRTRWRNLGISASLLVLLLAAVATLVRLSRKAQNLADLQMNFVTSVSHELRTPLTVIRTAAFNLRGRVAAKPDQVERYGKLIADESEKLTALVEQVMRFARAGAGRVIEDRLPVAVESLIDAGFRSSRAALDHPLLTVERDIAGGLPLILADELAMKHVVQNLLDNAVKYGLDGGNWIGLSAREAPGPEGSRWVEIRVADRGAGIPSQELAHVFDPFFRGRRALQDQVHGSGLGLNLVKKIVEAHGGSIHVNTEREKGAEFVVRIPAAPPEMQDEFAHSIG